MGMTLSLFKVYLIFARGVYLL